MAGQENSIDNYSTYQPTQIEKKWQSKWEDEGIYIVDDTDQKEKLFELTMYPYPSGDLHIGHWYAMAPSDTHARFKRMQGFNVLHPMGFDAFGLPAENAAIKDGIHPAIRTKNNIQNMRKQLRSMGNIYDWSREINTSLPEYYKWNQWIFLKFFESGLAYRQFAPANWCPTDNTVLANEQVIEGRCERCDDLVTRKNLNQWFFRITDYAEELLDHSKLDWPDKINIMQSNWIGKSEGVEIKFDISEYELEQKELITFTTRIDTIFGVTFVVIAPEHDLVPSLTTSDRRIEVNNYVEQARQQTEIERLSTDKEKTGVFTGSYCINPINGKRVPIFIADYVLLTYGTGVVMAVPAHDQRDFDFAKNNELPIDIVIAPENWDGNEFDAAYTDPGKQVNSGSFSGQPSLSAKDSIADFIENKGWGKRSINYRIRDWLISRQRYWGTPIPIIYCKDCGTVPVPETELPVLLPENAEFLPTGESPLKRLDSFINTICPKCGKQAERETDTMDTFVDSSWYQLRFANPNYDKGPFDKKAVHDWNPVGQYTGGAEHAVMHLLYARFFTKAMRDLRLIEIDEPFTKLFNQGHIIADHQKMSKSRGNVVAPDEYVNTVGADTVRCYLMFLGPWEQGGDWSKTGLNGISRWMNRIWEISHKNMEILTSHTLTEDLNRDLTRSIHKTTKKVTEDLERFKFNTALATLMEFTNSLNKVSVLKGIDPKTWDQAIETLLLLLAPFAPHISEELWEKTGHHFSIHSQKLPEWDPNLVTSDIITMIVQVNGKLRDKLEIERDISEDKAKELALSSQRIKQHIQNMKTEKIIYIPNKLINIVLS